MDKIQNFINWVNSRKEYTTFSFTEKYLSGHISIGQVTIYGENAMHWAVSISTKKWGYICFRLPFKCFGQWWPMYFYVSRNATPTRAYFWLYGKKARGF